MIKNISLEKINLIKNIELNIISFFFLLIPVSLITGRALPDILLSLIGLYFLIKCFNKKFILFCINIYTLPILVFSLYSVYSSLISDNKLISLTESGTIFYFRYFFFIMGAGYLISKKKNILKYFCNIFFFINIFVIFDAFFQLYFGFNLLGFERNSYQGRLSGIFNDELILGIFLSTSIPISIGLILSCYNLKLDNYFILTYLFVGFISIIISGDRMALMHYIIFIFIILLISKNISFKFFFLFIISLIVSFVLLLNFSDNVKKRFIETVSDYQDTKYYLPFTKVHEGHIISATKMFIDKPFFGQGPKLFKFNCMKDKFKNKYSCSTHPHNYYIQLLAETGIIGFLFLFCLFLVLLKRIIFNFYQKIQNNMHNLDDDNKFVYLVLLFSILWPLGPKLDIYNNWFNVILYLNIVLLLNSYNIAHKNSDY